MKQTLHLFSIKYARTVTLYTPVKTIQPMSIGFAGFELKIDGIRGGVA